MTSVATRIQAKKKCTTRPVAKSREEGIVAQDGKPSKAKMALS
jgi:hypothetical protein